MLSDYPQLAQVHAWQTTESGRSNVLRYAILHALGGVYVDADIEPLRPLDELLDGRPFAGWEDKSAICTAVMASPAGHPAAAALVDGLYEHARWRRGAASNMQTGPYYLTQTWQGRPDVRLLPPAAFYPVHWSAKNNLRPPYPPESYVAHHWAASWT